MTQPTKNKNSRPTTNPTQPMVYHEVVHNDASFLRRIVMQVCANSFTSLILVRVGLYKEMKGGGLFKPESFTPISFY